MRYTVVVKEVIGSNCSFKRVRRFNNVKGNIVRFLLKHNFCFKVGIANNIINEQTAKNYIEIYLKESHIIIGREKAIENAWLNYYLFKKLGGYCLKPTYTELL